MSSRVNGWQLAALAGALAAALLIPEGGSARTQTAPKNVTEPRVSGTAMQHKTLTTSNGTWSVTPTGFRYRWLRCDVNGGGVNGVTCTTIPYETRRAHTLTAADVGHRIRSRVIASNADGSDSANSNPTAVVQAAPTRPANTKAPTIGGTPQQGQTLTANHGSWSGTEPISYTYRWRRCDATGGSCSDISGATAGSYTLKTVDVGNSLRVRVTAANSRGSSSATSVPTAVITKAAAPSGAVVSISDVSLPNRLIIDRVSYLPSSLRAARSHVTARFRVSDSRDHPVSGAMVFVVGIPFGTASTPPEAATGPDGYVTFSIHLTRRARQLARSTGLVFFVRARKAGEPLLGGVSTRRLTYLPAR